MRAPLRYLAAVFLTLGMLLGGVDCAEPEHAGQADGGNTAADAGGGGGQDAASSLDAAPGDGGTVGPCDAGPMDGGLSDGGLSDGGLYDAGPCGVPGDAGPPDGAVSR